MRRLLRWGSGLFVLPAVRPVSRVAPAAAWALVIFILSAIPGTEYPQIRVPFSDKMVHGVIYAILGWLCMRAAVPGGSGVVARSRIVAATAFGCLYGMSDEIHQLCVPARSFSMADWAADCIGVAAGAAAWLAVWRAGANPLDRPARQQES